MTFPDLIDLENIFSPELIYVVFDPENGRIVGWLTYNGWTGDDGDLSETMEVLGREEVFNLIVNEQNN